MCELRGPALAERQHVQGLVAGDERVRARVRAVDEAVARAHVVRLSRPPREAAAREHVEDLLLGAVVVCRRRPPARLDADPAQSDGDRAGSAAEILPERIDVAALDRVTRGRHVIGVRKVLHDRTQKSVR